MKKPSIASILFLGLILNGSLAYADSTSDSFHPLSSEWKQQVMIYGWLAIPYGSVTYEVPDPEPGEPEEVESSVADNIDMFFMGTYRIEKDKYSVTLDGVYLAMSGEQKDSYAEASLDGWLAAFYSGYNIVNNRYIRFDLIAGVRYAYVGTEIKTSLIKNRKLSNTTNLWDGVIGFNGNAYITKKWFVPYHFDIGTGDSKLTTRSSLGIAYGFEWGDVRASYRHIYYDLSDSILIDNLKFIGPLIGVNVHF